MNTFSVLSWNIQGKRNFTGHTLFRKVKPYLTKTPADIIALQETCDAEKLLKNVEELKKFELYIPKRNKRNEVRAREYNNNVILSRYPITRTYEVSFPRLNDKINLENCSVAEVQISQHILRVYNCHLGIFRVGIATRLKQLEHILSDSLDHKGPVIICGDMNVAVPKNSLNRKIICAWHQEPTAELLVNGKIFKGDERELFNDRLTESGFKEVANLTFPTWSPLKTDVWEMFKLKLDWFATKDLNVLDHTLGGYISDHRFIEINAVMIDTANSSIAR